MKHLLYDGTVEVDFNEGVHRYNVTGISNPGIKPGVTGILSVIAKQGLMLWPMNEAIKYLIDNPGDYDGAKRAHLTKSNLGKDVGSVVHAYIEEYLKGNEPPVPAEAAKPIASFHRWLDRYSPNVIASERVIYSRIWDYAGSLDLVAEIDGEINLIDFKTSNRSQSAPDGIYAEYFIQLGGYDLAYSEEVSRAPTVHRVVNFAKTGGDFKEQLSRQIGIGTGGFLSALGLYKTLQRLQKETKWDIGRTG